MIRRVRLLAACVPWVVMRRRTYLTALERMYETGRDRGRGRL